jgi:hypothetical protein
MKTNQFPLTLALVAVILFGAMTCAAQNNNSNCQQQQQFGLNADLATFLSLTTAQIDSINKNLILLDYDWCEAKNDTITLDGQIAMLENDTSQSPTAIGIAAGTLIQQKVTIARAIIAEVQTSNKALLVMLTTSQQQKLAANQSAVNAQNTSNIYSINSDAFFGNLFVGQYSVVGFDPNNANMTYPSPPQTTTAAIGQMFAAAVEEDRGQRSKDQAAVARRARMIPLGRER